MFSISPYALPKPNQAAGVVCSLTYGDFAAMSKVDLDLPWRRIGLSGVAASREGMRMSILLAVRQGWLVSPKGYLCDYPPIVEYRLAERGSLMSNPRLLLAVQATPELLVAPTSGVHEQAVDQGEEGEEFGPWLNYPSCTEEELQR